MAGCDRQFHRQKSENGGVSSSLVHYPGLTRSHAEKDQLTDALYDAGMFNEYAKLRECGSKVLPFKCLDCEQEFYAPFRCDLRICPECSTRQAKIFVDRYSPILKSLMRDQKGVLRLMFLTLTTKNTGGIPTSDEIKTHNKAVGKIVKKYFKGGLAVNEIKYTFLHTHVIVYGAYTSRRKLSAYWEKLTGNEVIDIRQVKGDLKNVVRYITKYMRKPYDYGQSAEGHKMAVRYLQAFKGVRRVHSFGVFYAVKSKKVKSEFLCPFCGSRMVVVDEEKRQMGWGVKECRIRGTPSYQDVLNVWANTSIARA